LIGALVQAAAAYRARDAGNSHRSSRGS
jgi:hypothetical protein